MAVEDRTEQQLLTELATLQARVAQFEAREQALGASEPYRQIRLDGAVEHVRAEATAMRDSSDIGKVMAALYDGWRDSGLVFEAGCINIVDAEQRRYHTYALLPAAIMAAPVEGRILVEQDVTPGLNLYRSLDIDLDFARERGWAQPDLAASVWEAPATFPDDLAALEG